MSFSTVLNPLITVLSSLSGLEQVKSKLKKNPDIAGEKLLIVLSELGKSYQALDDSLLGLVTLSFDDEENMREAQRFLMDMQSGRLRIAVEAARGHCHTISNIYQRYLSKWFSRVLNRSEAAELEHLFRQLDEFDSLFIGSLERLYRQLDETVDQLLKDLKTGRIHDARSRVKKLANDLRDPRRDLASGLAMLWTLQGEFTELSGAV